MIRYALRCDRAHRFNSWFGSSADFERLSAGGLLSCAICGTTAVEKDVMAPSVARTAPSEEPQASEPAPLHAPASPAEQAMTELRRRIELIAEDVGPAFASEARQIHEGAAPARPIIGEATTADARALANDGIPVAPLPWSARRSN